MYIYARAIIELIYYLLRPAVGDCTYVYGELALIIWEKLLVILNEDEKQALLTLRLRPSSILTKNEGALSQPIAKSLSHTLTTILTQLSMLSNPSANI